MIKRLIKMNYKMVETDIVKSMVFLVAGCLFSLLLASWSSASIIVGMGTLIICGIFVIRGFNLIYNKSTFGDEAHIMMTLPATSKETVISKVLIGVIWICGIVLVELLSLLILMLPMHVGIEGLIYIFQSIWEPVDVKSLGMLTVIIYVVLQVIYSVVETGLLCTVIYTGLFVGEKLKMGKNRWVTSVVFVIVAILINLGINRVFGDFTKEISLNSIFITAGIIVAEVILSVVFVKFCETQLEKNYDLK